MNIIATIGNSEASVCGSPYSVLSLSIFVEETKRNQGLSKILLRLLVEKLITQLKIDKFSDNNIPFILLHIDTDASWNNNKSFWEHIGMNPARYENRQNRLPYCGYEKEICIRDLLRFLEK